MYKDIIVNYGTELKKYTGADLVENDVDAYRIVYRTPWDLTGCTVKALCRRSDGTVVSGMGFAEGTNAVFVMDSSMYAVPGELTVRLTVCTAEEQVITVCDIAANAVESFGDGIPGTNSKSILDQILINETKLNTAFEKHCADKSNPHAVTKEQVGLENVDNVRQAAKADFDAHTTDAVLDHPDGSVTADKIADGSINENKLNIELKSKLNGKADKGTKLSDYGIADAYTKNEADTKFDEKADADDVYTKTQTDTKFDTKENAANKVTEISDTSTNEQYPGAKAVNDAVNAAKTTANNKFANALKGTKTGASIGIDDISPIEHEMSVRVSSKNMIDGSLWKNSATANGVTVMYSKEEDCFILNGTTVKNTTTGIKPLNIYAKNKTTIFSTKYVSGTVNVPTGEHAVFYLGKGDSPTGTFANYRSTFDFKEEDTVGTPSTLTDYDYINRAWFYITSGVSFDNYKIRIQLEFGDEVTEYTPYISDLSSVTVSKKKDDGTVAAIYTPSADGKVTGVNSLYPVTGLSVNNSGAVITAEYNCDITKAFSQLEEKFINAILSSGGNV